MKGDFSRLTFDPRKQYRAVRMQQGRVQLDADWNEQNDIVNYILETQMRDLLGAAGAPRDHAGFKITIVDGQEKDSQRADSTSQAGEEPQQGQLEFAISPGRYYVNGILCESEQEHIFSSQPFYPHATLPSRLEDLALVYLDTWLRHVTAQEDASLYESALGGIDTTTRLQSVWQVKILPIKAQQEVREPGKMSYHDSIALPEWQALVSKSGQKGRLAAVHNPQLELGNQLYRVEIHSVHEKKITFKWSRENGSVVFALNDVTVIERKDAASGSAQFVVTLQQALRDSVQLQKGDWVEFVDEEAELTGHSAPLYQVIDLPDFTSSRITLAGQRSRRVDALLKQKKGSLLLRRWDQSARQSVLQDDGTILLQEDAWLTLEKGIQVRFSPGKIYAVGDYWLIPARTLADGIEWPVGDDGPLALLPQGIKHHYAPLALLHLHKGRWSVASDVRQIFATLPAITAQEKEVEEKEEIGRLTEVCLSENALLEEGDVVALVPEIGQRVVKSNSGNAHLLLGVVAGKHHRSEKHVSVTTYGRARCKVVGSVEWGNLLVVSHHNGCAHAISPEQRASHYGSILGKALGAHHAEDDREIGVIEVMVTLQ